jgi:hypothetical protein
MQGKEPEISSQFITSSLALRWTHLDKTKLGLDSRRASGKLCGKTLAKEKGEQDDGFEID